MRFGLTLLFLLEFVTVQISCSYPFSILSTMDNSITVDDLLDNCPNFRPELITPTLDQVLPITAFVYAKRIINVDDSAEEMTFTGAMEIQWAEVDCSNKEAFTNRSKHVTLYPPPFMFWKPRIEIPQSQELLTALDRQETLQVKIQYPPYLEKPLISWIWTVRGLFRFHCDLDLFLFPNDVQNCTIQFQLQEMALIYYFSRCEFPPFFQLQLKVKIGNCKITNVQLAKDI